MSQFTDSKKIYLKDYDKNSLIVTIREFYEHEREGVISRTDLLMDGYFVFQNEWDMERSHDPVYMPLDEINWNYIPTDDMEWAYMLHRQNYLMDLI